jgi:hypothetical protein
VITLLHLAAYVTQSVSSTFFEMHNRTRIRNGVFRIGEMPAMKEQDTNHMMGLLKDISQSIRRDAHVNYTVLRFVSLDSIRYLADFLTVTNYRECHHSDHEVFACHALHFSLFILQSFSILRHERPIEHSWDWPSSNRFLHSAKGILLVDCVKLPAEPQRLSN